MCNPCRKRWSTHFRKSIIFFSGVCSCVLSRFYCWKKLKHTLHNICFFLNWNSLKLLNYTTHKYMSSLQRGLACACLNWNFSKILHCTLYKNMVSILCMFAYILSGCYYQKRLIHTPHKNMAFLQCVIVCRFSTLNYLKDELLSPDTYSFFYSVIVSAFLIWNH